LGLSVTGCTFHARWIIYLVILDVGYAREIFFLFKYAKQPPLGVDTIEEMKKLIHNTAAGI
jgi:hypothetical protein